MMAFWTDRCNCLALGLHFRIAFVLRLIAVRLMDTGHMLA